MLTHQSFDLKAMILCVDLIVYGCTSLDSLEYWDYNAANFTIDYFDFDFVHPNVDDGSCSEPVIFGCADPIYLEYWSYDEINYSISSLDTIANVNDGSCSRGNYGRLS